MKRYIRINKLNRIFLLILFSFYLNTQLFSDLGSDSPTIDDHIFPYEWMLSGLKGGDLSNDFPVITGTVPVDNPTGDDFQKIDEAIDDAYAGYLANGGIWAVMLQPSSAGKYVVNKTIEMKSNVILCGPYQWKEDKDEDDRAIIEFDIIDYGGVNGYNRNCISFKGTEQAQLENAGVEDVYIKRIDTSGNPTGTRSGVNIYMENCNNCFVSGVESYYPQNHHVTMYNCNHIEVRGCYFHEAQDYGEGGDGYGAVCDNSSYCLVEDNIFNHLRHSMLLQNEANYNVYGYNYSIKGKQTNFEIPWYLWIIFPVHCAILDNAIDEDFTGDMVCHGHPEDGPGPMANLFEGNIGQFMWVDLHHWCNGPDNTFHRNAALKHGYHIYPWQKTQNIVNNFLKEDDRWLHLYLGSPRIRLLSSPYFESYSHYVYRNIWGNKKNKVKEQNLSLFLSDIFNGGCQNTWENDISYYKQDIETPFNPKTDKNSAELRYVSGYKRTVSRHDPFDVVTYYMNGDLIFDPPNSTIPSNIDPSWIYDDHIKVPNGAALYIPAGTTLQFAPDTYMLIRGHLLADGTENDEIIFSGIDDGEWDGLCFGRRGGMGGWISSSSELNHCTIRDIYNTKYYYDGVKSGCVMVNYYENITIDNCKFINNYSRIVGGAILLNSRIGKISNCYFENNQGHSGGGLAIQNSWFHPKSEIINNLFINNQAIGDVLYHNSNGRGGAIYINCTIYDSLYILCNTYYNNKYTSYSGSGHDLGGGMYIRDSDHSGARYIYNNLFLNNGSFDGDGPVYPGDEFYIDESPNNVFFYNNCIKRIPYNDPSSLGNNYIEWDEEDLLLADPSQNDLHLNYGSPLIGIGMSPVNSLDSLIFNLYASTDLDGNPRVVLDTIDIGCYEYYEPGIYLPQQEIDFGGVPHDRKAIRELVIKNIGSDDLNNIEITFADTIAEYYTIDPDDIPAVIPPSPTDSVCIPIEFCCHKMFVHCDGLITITSSDPYMPEVQMLVYGSPALDNAWNWISFPALDRDASGNQDAEEVLEPLVPNAHKLITQVGDMIYDGSYWTHSNLDDIISTVGYKLKMFNNYAYYPFSMVGDSISLIPADTEIYLEEGYNWIGYWLPQSQNFDEAFGIDNGNFEKVISIQAENWFFGDPFYNQMKGDPYDPWQSFPLPSSTIRPLHYGRGYIVKMSEPIDLVWNDPDGGNTKEEGYAKTEAFSFDEKETYEVIDVIGLDGSAQEIGVFNSGDECLGAAKIDSLGSAQILAYTDTQAKEGTELLFMIYQGKGIKESNNFLLYDFDLEEFIEAPLKAGIRKYNIVLFDSNNPQLLDKLILQQNVPNPFNHKMKNTSISFALPQKDNVKLKIYNIKGQLIKTVIDNKEMDAGYYTVQWNGRNEENKKVCNGVYLYKIENSNSSIIKKMIILE